MHQIRPSTPVKKNTDWPAERHFQPGQQGGQEGEADELRGGVDGDAGGTLALAEPGGGDAVVDQEARYLEQPDGHAQDDQHDQAGGQAQR